MKTTLKLSLVLSLLLATWLPGTVASAQSCLPTQSIEEGPYYLSSTPVRSNITDGQPGKRMTLAFQIRDTSCKPVKGARVDIWYANASGLYSGVVNMGDDLGAGKNSGLFLRGTQFTNDKGVVTFKGIYPGWYPARTIHIHEKVWVGGRQVLTTQTYFTDKQNEAVMATPPYKARGKQAVTNSTDMVLRRGVDLKAALMKFKGSKASATLTISR